MAEQMAPGETVEAPGAPVLSVEHISKRFTTSAGLGTKSRVVDAVQDVSFTVAAGEVVSVVGETGSGKTTLAGCISGLTVPTSGRVVFKGADMASISRAAELSFAAVSSPFSRTREVRSTPAGPLNAQSVNLSTPAK